MPCSPSWIMRTDVYLSLIYDSKVIHADESPVKVMRIDHAKIKNGRKTYIWVYRNRPLRGTHPIVLFDWQPSRHSDHPREFLKTFSGTVLTDGYQVYHKLTTIGRKNFVMIESSMTKISGLLMIFFHGHPESRKNAQADTKNLDFSMCISIL